MSSDEQTLAEDSNFSLLAAGFGQGPEFDSVLRAALHSSNPRERIIALRGLVRQNLTTTQEWVQSLEDSDPDVRREALQQFAYAQPRDAALLALVLQLLADSDPLVVDAAVFACGELELNEAVEALCAIASSHDDARCRESAVAALGSIGDERGLPVILQSLEDKPPVRRRAIVALANFEGPEVDAALEKASDDRDWQVRAAVGQLGRDID